MRMFDQVRQIVGGATVFGEPYDKEGITVIPASYVWGGGGGGQEAGAEAAGGGGVGVMARPAGAFVIKDGDVRWVPAIDVGRIIVVGQLLMIVAILSWRSVAKARAKRR